MHLPGLRPRLKCDMKGSACFLLLVLVLDSQDFEDEEEKEDEHDTVATIYDDLSFKLEIN